MLLVPGYGGSTSGLEVLAERLRSDGRDVRVVPAAGAATGDLRERAADLGRAVDEALADSGAPSVDVVGYSAGGVVLRLYVADLGGGSTVRRAVTLSSPHHGTDLAALAAVVRLEDVPGGLPAARSRLRPAARTQRWRRDARPARCGWRCGPRTTRPSCLRRRVGSTARSAYAVQDVCPALAVGHPDVPRAPEVAAMVEAAIGTGEPTEPGPEACGGS